MKYLASTILTLSLLFPLMAFAQAPAPEPPARIPRGLGGARGALEQVGKEGYGIDRAAAQGGASAEAVAGRILNVFFGVLGIVFLALMLYGGYIWMTARGSEELVTKAKDLITQAIIGIVIIIAAYAITEFVILRLFGAASIKPAG